MADVILCPHCLSRVEAGKEQCPFCDKSLRNTNPPGTLPYASLLAGRYTVGRHISTDGEGVTYAALENSGGVRVILKEYFPVTLSEGRDTAGAILPKEGKEVLFKTTRMDFADLHRSIMRITPTTGLAAVLDVVETNNTAYAVLEQVGGESLSHYLSEHPGCIPVAQARSMMQAVMEGVAALHKAGLVHRGISPENILLTGSGTQDRDETIMEHKPFLVIADYLTRHGIAVLRFDDRGAGRSEGNPTTATTADFATDAEAALDYLKQRKEINASRIGFLGHSEGGCIAFHVAGKRKDVAFVVSLAGTGLPGDSILLYQNHIMARTLQMPEETWKAQNDMLKKIYDIAKSELSDKEAARMIVEAGKSVLPSTPAPEQTEVLKKQAQAITLPWMRYFLKYDPRTDLAKMHCHLLALNGEKDMQVEAEANLKAIKEASKSENGRRITIMQYPGLNHLFQHCQTGMVNEYARIEETISPEVLNDIAAWINSLF